MSSNDTWMPLYIGDYLGDTMELDGAQHGAYLLLLMYYWRNGPLPADDVKLAQIARTDLRLWKKTVGPVVKAFFTENGGRLHQKRCDLELAKAKENWQRASEQRYNDNQRLRAWRAKDGSHPPTKPNGHGPPETAMKRVSSAFPNPSQTRCETPPETVAKSVLPSPSTKTFSGGEKEESFKKSSSLPSNLTVGSRAREETPPADALRTLLDEAGESPHHHMRPLKPATDSVGSGPVAAQVSRVAKALSVSVPYGVVRSAESQIAQLGPQSEVVNTSGYRWQPCDPVRTVEEQLAILRGAA